MIRIDVSESKYVEVYQAIMAPAMVRIRASGAYGDDLVDLDIEPDEAEKLAVEIMAGVQNARAYRLANGIKG